MSFRKLVTALVFLLILLALGTSDFFLTRDTLRFPLQEGVTKQTGPDVVAIATAQGFTVAETTEQNLLPHVIPLGARSTFSTHVLLKDDDRAATIGWIDAPDVKAIFTALRKNLRPQFSAELEDLIDETQSEPGKPPRDILSFRDPGILDDRAVFVRVRERLYELHVKEDRVSDIDKLIDALTE